jgi:hypothetical protein
MILDFVAGIVVYQGGEMLIEAVAISGYDKIISLAWSTDRPAIRFLISGINAFVSFVRSYHHTRVIFDGMIICPVCCWFIASKKLRVFFWMVMSLL